MAKDFRFPKGIGFPGDVNGPRPGSIFWRGSTPDALVNVIGSDLFGENTPGAGASIPRKFSTSFYPDGNDTGWPAWVGAFNGGLSQGAWIRRWDLGPLPWSFSNLYTTQLQGDNWSFTAMAGNCLDMSGTGCNSQGNVSLAVRRNSGDAWVFEGDHMYFQFMAGSDNNGPARGQGTTVIYAPGQAAIDAPVELTPPDYQDYIYQYTQIVPSAAGFTIRTWVIFRGVSYLFGPFVQDVAIADIRTAIAAGGFGWTQPEIDAWTPTINNTSGSIGFKCGSSSHIHGHAYLESSQPTDQTVIDRAWRTTPDTSAYGWWSLDSDGATPNLTDQSGNSRNAAITTGTWARGPISMFPMPQSGTQTTAIIASGGVVLGGTATKAVKAAEVASGGILIGGTATKAAKRATIGSSGFVLGGSATVAFKRAIVGSAGVVIGGASANSSAHSGNTTAIIGSSGPVVGGSAIVAFKRAHVAISGAILGGAATVAFKRAIAGSAGVLIGGSATTNRKASPTGSAGVIIGGSSTIAKHANNTATGGVTVGGASPIAAKRALVASSGLVIGGAAAKAAKATSIASGGLVAGGSATTARKAAVTGSAGVRLGGSATTNRKAAPTGSAGIIIGGASQISRHAGIIAAAGVVLGGTSPNNSGQPGHGSIIASGGAVLGGSAIVACKRVAIAGSGFVMGGASVATAKRNAIGSSGTVLGGSSTVAYKRVITGARGIVLGGVTSTSRHALVTPTGGPTIGGAAGIAVKCAKLGAGGVILGGSAFQGVPGIAYIDGVPHAIAFGDVMVSGVPRRIVGGWVQVSGTWRAVV